MSVILADNAINNYTLFCINLSYLFFLCGMLLGEKTTNPIIRYSTSEEISKNNKFVPYRIILIILFGLLLNTSTFLFPNIVQSLGIGPKMKLIVNVIFDYKFYFVIFFLLTINQYKYYKFYEKLILALFLTIFVISKLVIGVKSGIIQVLIFSIIVLLTMRLNFKIPKKFLIISIFLFPLIILTYALGLAIRVSIANDLFLKNVSLLSLYLNVFENFSIMDSNVLVIIEKFFKRTNQINQIDILINKEVDIIEILINYYQFLVNLILPGSLFPDAIPPSVYFKVPYLNHNLYDALNNYRSDMLPLYGELYSLVGPFSLILLFWIGFFYIRTINYLYEKKYFPRVLVCALSMYFLSLLLFNMGFVGFFEQLLYSIIPAIIFTLFFKKTYILLNDLKPQIDENKIL